MKIIILDSKQMTGATCERRREKNILEVNEIQFNMKKIYPVQCSTSLNEFELKKKNNLNN